MFNHDSNMTSFNGSSSSLNGDADSSEFGYITIAIALLGTATCLFSIYVTLATHVSATSASIGAAATSFNTLFISLSVASLFVCGVTLPVSSYTAITGGKNWFAKPHRSLICLVEAFVQASALDTALYSHGFIAVNRLLAASTFSQRHITGSKMLTVIFVVFSWVMPVLLYVFPLFHYGGSGTFRYSHTTNRCQLMESRSLVYWHFTKLLHFFLPFGMMIACYLTILLKIMASNRRVQQDARQGVEPSLAQINTGNSRRMRKEIQVTQSVFITCLSFVMCYLPNTVYAIMVYRPQQIDAEPNLVTQLLLWIGCSFNPFLYIMINHQMRNKLHFMVVRALHRQSSRPVVNIIQDAQNLPPSDLALQRKSRPTARGGSLPDTAV